MILFSHFQGCIQISGVVWDISRYYSSLIVRAVPVSRYCIFCVVLDISRSYSFILRDVSRYILRCQGYIQILLSHCQSCIQCRYILRFQRYIQIYSLCQSCIKIYSLCYAWLYPEKLSHCQGFVSGSFESHSHGRVC